MGWLVAPSLYRSLIKAQFSSDNLAPGDTLWLDPKTNFNPKNYNFAIVSKDSEVERKHPAQAIHDIIAPNQSF